MSLDWSLFLSAKHCTFNFLIYKSICTLIKSDDVIYFCIIPQISPDDSVARSANGYGLFNPDSIIYSDNRLKSKTFSNVDSARCNSSFSKIMGCCVNFKFVNLDISSGDHFHSELVILWQPENFMFAKYF